MLKVCMTVQYVLPDYWIKYDLAAIVPELTEAKAAVLSLTSIPFQRSWAERLQEMELKREVAGTSRIEGADFTDREFEEAVAGKTPQDQLTRSQRQARAAINTYRWIATLAMDRPIDGNLIREIHFRIVKGCDDDHCPPGELRGPAQNVTFGRPRHRGVEGGEPCEQAVRRLVGAVNQEFRGHDPLIQALALHYHFGAMHPFYDGNGRTARALEALYLQRAQLKDSLFIAMSNYYYDEKDAYLKSLSEVRQSSYDLTPFLKFGLHGIAVQCKRLLKEIRIHVQRSLFRDVIGKMYSRLQSTRKRALASRQCEMLNKLLDKDSPIEYRELFDMLQQHYRNLSVPFRAFVRDLNQLSAMRATLVVKEPADARPEAAKYNVSIRLDWATEITESDFYKRINEMPEAKTKLIVSR